MRKKKNEKSKRGNVIEMPLRALSKQEIKSLVDGVPPNEVWAIAMVNTVTKVAFDNDVQARAQFLQLYVRSFLLTHANKGSEHKVLRQFAKQLTRPGIDIKQARGMKK